MTLYQITMLCCPEEWITGKTSMTPAEAMAAGYLTPRNMKGYQGPAAAEPSFRPAAASRPAGGVPAWRRAAARLMTPRR